MVEELPMVLFPSQQARRDLLLAVFEPVPVQIVTRTHLSDQQEKQSAYSGLALSPQVTRVRKCSNMRIIDGFMIDLRPTVKAAERYEVASAYSRWASFGGHS
jgi:hypothetical protein